MNPGTRQALVLLSRFVGLLPIAFGIPPQPRESTTQFARRLLALQRIAELLQGHENRLNPVSQNTMPESLEQTLILVWRQVLVEDAKTVTVNGRSSPVRRTSRSKLREVDFQFEGQMLRGLEQNPNTNSRWAKLAREGKKIMQFLSGGRYIANVVDGKVHLY